MSHQQLKLAESNTAVVSLEWRGGLGMFTGEASVFGTIALQIQTPNGTWVGIPNYATTTPVSLSANSSAIFNAPVGQIRAVLTGTTAAFAYAIGIPSNDD